MKLRITQFGESAEGGARETELEHMTLEHITLALIIIPAALLGVLVIVCGLKGPK